MTIRTVTLSPGFDHVVVTDDLPPGGVGKVVSWEVLAGGKGVNVTRTSASLGVESVAYTLVGEDDREDFIQLITRHGASVVTESVPGQTRRNLTLTVQSARATASHATGPRLATATDDHVNLLIDRLLDEVRPGDLVTFNGAVPDGIDDRIWARTAEALLGRDVTLIADVQGTSLLRLLASRGDIAMVKPNTDEAQDLTPHDDGRDLWRTARTALASMSAAGVADPVVSMGGSGVLHLVAEVRRRSWCPVPTARLTVGAGDAFVAGYCSAIDSADWAHVEPVTLGLATAAAHISGRRESDLRPAVMDLVPSVRSSTDDD